MYLTFGVAVFEKVTEVMTKLIGYHVQYVPYDSLRDLFDLSRVQKSFCTESAKGAIASGTVVQYFSKTDSTTAMCTPVLLNGFPVGVLHISGNIGRDSFEIDEVQVLEWGAVSCSFSLKIDQLQKTRNRENCKAAVLLSISKAFLSDQSVEISLGLVVDSLYKSLNPQMVSLYMCDRVQEEAWICISKDGLEGLTVPFGVG